MRIKEFEIKNLYSKYFIKSQLDENPFAPSGICGYLWRTLRHIIIKGDDGVKVVLCC